jgi:hypothetical protein
MQEIKVSIQGKTPLLCNRFTDEAQMSATSGTSLATVGSKGTPLEQAEKCLYVSAHDGALIIPQPNLFRCLLDAGKFFKAGKSKVTTQKSSLISACLELNEVEYPIGHDEPWTVDTRSVRIPATGGRILRHRPCFYDWRLSFVAELDDTVISLELFRDIVDKAGSAIGLGDFRPDCKGPFGKFRVTHWDASQS